MNIFNEINTIENLEERCRAKQKVLDSLREEEKRINIKSINTGYMRLFKRENAFLAANIQLLDNPSLKEYEENVKLNKLSRQTSSKNTSVNEEVVSCQTAQSRSDEHQEKKHILLPKLDIQNKKWLTRYFYRANHA